MKKSTTLSTFQAGFALLTAMWIAAVLSVLAATLLSDYLSTANSLSVHHQNLHAEKLHDAALRSAVYSILAPREDVSAAGIPKPEYVYPNPISHVTVRVQNEAAFLDLNVVDANLVRDIFEHLDLDPEIVDALNRSASRDVKLKQNSFKTLRSLVRQDDKAFQRLTQYVTFYSGGSQLNTMIASEALIKALPELSLSDAEAILDNRSRNHHASFSSAINHPMLGHRASNHYRISTQFKLGSRTFSKVRIIRLDLENRARYKLVAEL